MQLEFCEKQSNCKDENLNNKNIADPMKVINYMWVVFTIYVE